MPPPITVDLLPHDPQWSISAREESSQLFTHLGSALVEVHHIGSTAIPEIVAKPILDLLPVFQSLNSLDELRPAIEAMGYQWWGELGLPGRRYCTKNSPITGKRLVQLHCYAVGTADITRHVAFRDYLRQRPDLARAYELEKLRCQRLFPCDSHAYCDCKTDWIRQIEAEALASLKPSDL